MRILMGFAEAVPAAEAYFSLSDAGHEVAVFTRQGARTPVLTRLPVGAPVVVCSPEEDAQAAIRDLVAGLAGYDAVFAIDDPSLWLVNAALEQVENPPLVINATGAQADLALNKIAQIEAARRAEIPVPQTVIAHGPEDLVGVDFLPAIVKPAMAEQLREGALTRGGAYYAFDREELEALINAPEKLTFPMLVQPLVHGVGEGVFGFATEQGVVNWMGHERVRMMNPHGSGSSACRSLMPDAETKARVTAFIKDIGWRGPFMVELLRDDAGTRWFMEINGRLWGSLALARRAGFEYPAWAVGRAIDPQFTPAEQAAPASPLTLRHLGREIVHLMFLIRGPKSAFHKERWPGLWSSLKGVFAPARLRHFYNYDPAHKGYMWADALSVILKQIRKR